jgi:hypothetical protein
MVRVPPWSFVKIREKLIKKVWRVVEGCGGWLPCRNVMLTNIIPK